MSSVTECSNAMSHFCFHCHKDNLPDDKMHEVDGWVFNKDDITYQMYVCSNCWKIIHVCARCDKLFFDANPANLPFDLHNGVPICSDCYEHIWDHWW